MGCDPFYLLFEVPGWPAPWRVPKIGVARKGRRSCVPTPDRERMKAWKATVFRAAQLAMAGRRPFAGNCHVRATFYMPNYQYAKKLAVGTGKTISTHLADATNLGKATEDGLQGAAIVSDRTCVTSGPWQRFVVAEPAWTGAVIEIKEVPGDWDLFPYRYATLQPSVEAVEEADDRARQYRA